MPVSIFDKVEKHLDMAGATNQKIGELLPHFKRTVYWIQILNPYADEALKIAALAHDFDKLEDLEEILKSLKESPKGALDEERTRFHEETAAKRIGEFLISQGAPTTLADRVSLLVSRHEEGGSEEQNLLKDADSISFLENVVEHFIEMTPIIGREKVINKFNYMYDRITSEKAKEIAKPMYDEACEKISHLKV